VKIFRARVGRGWESRSVSGARSQRDVCAGEPANRSRRRSVPHHAEEEMRAQCLRPGGDEGVRGGGTRRLRDRIRGRTDIRRQPGRREPGLLHNRRPSGFRHGEHAVRLVAVVGTVARPRIADGLRRRASLRAPVMGAATSGAGGLCRLRRLAQSMRRMLVMPRTPGPGVAEDRDERHKNRRRTPLHIVRFIRRPRGPARPISPGHATACATGGAADESAARNLAIKLAGRRSNAILRETEEVASTARASGGIGRRARLRAWWG
jgi:hypothetical protein